MKTITKDKLLLHFVNTSNNNCESEFYFDPALSDMPNELLYDLISELAEEGYLIKRIRAVRLKPKAYSFKHDRRIARFSKIVSVLGRPISYSITWGLGILSALLIEYLLKILHLNP